MIVPSFHPADPVCVLLYNPFAGRSSSIFTVVVVVVVVDYPPIPVRCSQVRTCGVLITPLALFLSLLLPYLSHHFTVWGLSIIQQLSLYSVGQ